MDQRLHDAIHRVKGDGKSRNIPCPAHRGRKQSLRIFRGDDGGIGLRCYSKECSTAAILDATGLSRSILRPDGARRERLLRVEHDIGATYDYTDDSGALLFQVVRQQPKGFFQRRPGPDGGWLANLKGTPTPRPPYRLVDLSKPERAEETVFVVEGEKDADLLAQLGLLATTNAGGAGKASSTDWSVLAGRRVVILPDNDDKGAAHARDLVRLLSPVAKDVRVVRLPDLPPKGDVSDWAKLNRNGADPSSLTARLIEIANDASPTLAPTNMGTAPTDHCAPVEDAPKPWRPFPVDLMPEPFCSFIRRSAIARQCDPAAVALPLLAALGGTIGNTTRLRLWPEWLVPPVIWAAIISPSGSVKSPAFRAALAPLDAVEREDRVGFDSAQAEYERACMTYDAELADWRRKHDRGEPPEKSAPPVLVRRIIDDTTIQALGHVLAENPRGVLLARDELSGWVRSFDQFHAAAGADVARWLEFYNAGSIRVDRVGKGHLHIPRAAVSICGTIQDEVLLNAFTREHRSNGLLARFMLARPPETRRRWRSSESAHGEAEAVQRRFEQLARLPIPEPRADPREIRLSADAEALY